MSDRYKNLVDQARNLRKAIEEQLEAERYALHHITEFETEYEEWMRQGGLEPRKVQLPRTKKGAYWIVRFEGKLWLTMYKNWFCSCCHEEIICSDQSSVNAFILAVDQVRGDESVYAVLQGHQKAIFSAPRFLDGQFNGQAVMTRLGATLSHFHK